MFTWFTCCCNEEVDKHQITTSSLTAENLAVATFTSAPASSTVEQAPASRNVGQGETITDCPTKGSEPLLSPVEKESEKARLHQIVNDFAKKAVKGCPCAFLKETSSNRCNTEYRVDRSLAHINIMSENNPDEVEVSCPIASIQDVFSFAEDGDAFFPKTILQQLKPDEHDLLLMVVYTLGPDKKYRFCFLEHSRASRDVFLESLRVLCIYAQSADAAGSAPVALDGA